MRSPLLAGLLNPLNILMLLVTVLAGLVAAWWLFPLGILLWIVMVAVVARNPSLRFSHQMQKREPLAQRFQRYFDRIERAQVSVFNTLASAPPRTRRVFQPLRAELDALTDQVYRLCQRMTSLENYRLVSQSQADLEADLEHIDEALQGSTDPLVRREYEDSRKSLEQTLTKLTLVSTQLDRVEAQILSLASEMDSLVAEVIRLQAAGPENAARHVPELVERIREESAQLKQFEREAVEV